jgi:hypothetical protein
MSLATRFASGEVHFQAAEDLVGPRWPHVWGGEEPVSSVHERGGMYSSVWGGACTFRAA